MEPGRPGAIFWLMVQSRSMLAGWLAAISNERVYPISREKKGGETD